MPNWFLIASRDLIAALICLAGIGAAAQDSFRPESQAEPSAGFRPLPPVTEELDDLQQQVNELRAELATMKDNASHGFLADAPAKPPTPEQQQEAFHKQYDKARSR